MVHMFGVDIGHDRNGRGQTVERAVAFIGLNHHPFALPHTGVRAIGVNDAAVDHRGIKATLIQKCRNHRRRRCLAVGARDRNVGFQAHQFREHFCAAHNRQALGTRLIKLGVARFDGGRNHNHLARLPDFQRAGPQR